jgi:hypothetical protein
MFRAASDQTWPEVLPVLDEDGNLDYTTCLFMCTFTIIIAWVPSIYLSVAPSLPPSLHPSRPLSSPFLLTFSSLQR